jgi:hypothetical protein
MKAAARMPRIAIRLISLMGVVLFVIGLVEIYNSRGLPEFTDSSAVGRLQGEYPPNESAAREAFFADWHEERWALEGGRFILFDKGTFDLTAGLVLLACVGLLPKAVRAIGRKRLALEAEAGVVIAIGIGAHTAYSAILDYDRLRLNHVADSLGIPIMSGVFGALAFLVFAMILIFLVGPGLRRQKSELWPAVKTTPRRALVCGLVFLPVLILELAGIVFGRPYSASWIMLIMGTAFLLVLASWYQSALTPPNRAETVSPEGVA